jgi:hypothetical protein
MKKATPRPARAAGTATPKPPKRSTMMTNEIFAARRTIPAPTSKLAPEKSPRAMSKLAPSKSKRPRSMDDGMASQALKRGENAAKREAEDYKTLAP